MSLGESLIWVSSAVQRSIEKDQSEFGECPQMCGCQKPCFLELISTLGGVCNSITLLAPAYRPSWLLWGTNNHCLDFRRMKWWCPLSRSTCVIAELYGDRSVLQVDSQKLAPHFIGPFVIDHIFQHSAVHQKLPHHSSFILLSISLM